MFTAVDAQQWGLISRTVPTESLEIESRTILELLVNGPTSAFGQSKKLLRQATRYDLADQLDHEATAITKFVDEPNAHEGIDAFLARRAPRFT